MGRVPVKSVAFALVLAVLMGMGWSRIRKGAERRINVLIVTMDTTRADHIGVYGDPAAHTPNLDAFADRGCLFEYCYAPVPLTLPSHSTLFTGLYPFKLNVRENGIHRLGEEYATLAKLFKQQGYETGAVIAAFVLDSRFGLAQGFDFYEDDLGSAVTGRRAAIGGFAERQGGEVTDLAVRWLGQRRSGKPFFLWVHYFDPHASYTPPPPYDERFKMNPYDGEIAYMDECFSRLCKALPRNTLVVVVADHGEALGEHDLATHGLFVYDDCLRVPLMMSGPGVPRGRVVEENVRLADVFPTVCELVGLKPSQIYPLDGKSLVALMRGEQEPELRECYGETGYGLYQHGWSELRTIRQGPWKYIEAPRPELYNIKEDPFELNNLLGKGMDALSSEAREQREALRLGLEKLTEGWPTFEEVGMEKLAPAEAALLQDLGYIDRMPDIVEGRERPDPKDRVQVMSMLGVLRASENRRDMDPEEKLDLVDQVLRLDQDNIDALFHRTMVFLNMGDVDRAEREALQIMSRSDSWKYRCMMPLGMCALKRGELYRGLHLLETSRDHTEIGSGVHISLANIYLRLNRVHDAMVAFQYAIDINPFAVSEAYNGMGVCLEFLGRYDEAIEYYERSLAMGADRTVTQENLERCRESRNKAI